MKTIVLILIAVLALALVGCAKTTVTNNGVTSTIETNDGQQTTTVTGNAGDDGWCPEGGNWQMQSEGTQGSSEAEWKIDKLETSGEYSGLCHVIYTAKTPQGDIKMDYWFDESGENGYYEMDMNGQKIKQEWHNS